MSHSKGQIRFGEFVFDGDELLLFKGREPLPVPPKALQLLAVLIENRGKLLGKNELMDRVWQDSFVEEGNLAYTMGQLRKALGDDVRSPRFVETIPRRGYRFIADVESAADTGRESSWQKGRMPSDDAGDAAFIGRTKVIAEISGLLERSDTRLITLTGTGGTGKTRLSKEIGRRMNGPFPDGVYFVEMASVTDISLAATFIAHTLGVTEPGQRSIEDVLADHFRGKSALLILDNFEQIIDAAPVIAQIVKASPPLKVLITSREPLKLKIETEYRVPPLAVPPPEHETTAFALMRFEAVEFFLDRAKQANPELVTSEADMRSVAAICSRLDGLPLALELAAARARILSAAEIYLRLENSLGLLTGGPKDMPERQQTMRSTIAWSYELLSEQEKAVFERLAVFEGGFTYDAAEKVLMQGEGSPDGVAILDAITSLVEKGLLVAEPGAGVPRFRMLVVVREFAWELLERSGFLQDVQRTHAAYFTDLVESAEPGLLASQVGKLVTKLEADHDNIRAAMRWSIRSDPAVSSRIAKAMRLFWMLRGYTREGQYWYREVLKAGDVPPEYRWILLTGLGNMTQFRGDLTSAVVIYEESLEESRKVGVPKFIAQSKRGIGGARYMLGDFAAAKRHINEALKISRENADEFGTAAALARLGDIALAEGNAALARRMGEQALQKFRELEFRPGIGSKLTNLGMAEVADGAIDGAWEHLSESLKVASEAGDYITTRLGLEGISLLFCEAGDHFNAARLSAAAFRMGDEIDHLLEPAEARLREMYTEKLRSAMGEPGYESAYSLGLQMTREEAVDLAMGRPADEPARLRLLRKRPRSRV